VEGFFLHIQATWKISELYPRVFKKRGASAGGKIRDSGLADFGWRGMLYEVGQDGGYGTVKEVEQLNLYEFINYVSYLRAQNKYRDLATATPKAGRR